MAKTIKEINEKIKSGAVVVVTAEEVIDLVEKKGLAETAKKVDVVTTGTFGPMCSSGAYLNIGHAKPKIKLGGGRVTLNDVPAYTGFAAVDIYIGATAMPDDDPRNKVYPMPIDAEGKDATLVGRIRQDESIKNGISMWIVADNIRKGAALNAIQIAELL